MTYPYDTKQFARCPDEAAVHGACVKLGTYLFDQMVYPGEDRKARDQRNLRAKSICRSCPALEACREWAMTSPDPAAGDGRIGFVAGGLTLEERNGIRRQDLPIKHGTCGGYTNHYKRGEKPCEACRIARRFYDEMIASPKRKAS